jgi:hypothetical protein
MQFAPERYPSADVKFIPTATLGIIAREYEQKQLAFLIQTLGAQSPLTPILMQGIIRNSSLNNREQMLEQMAKQSQPDPQQQQMAQQNAMLDMKVKNADATKKEAEAMKAQAEAEATPLEAKAKIISALSNNLDDQQEGRDFERRAKIAELMLAEKDITSNENIAKMQMEVAREKNMKDKEYVDQAAQAA